MFALPVGTVRRLACVGPKQSPAAGRAWRPRRAAGQQLDNLVLVPAQGLDQDIGERARRSQPQDLAHDLHLAPGATDGRDQFGPAIHKSSPQESSFAPPSAFSSVTP